MILKCVGKNITHVRNNNSKIYTVLMAAHNPAVEREQVHGIHVTEDTYNNMKEGNVYAMAFNLVTQADQEAKEQRHTEENEQNGPAEKTIDGPIGEVAHSHDGSDAQDEVKPKKKK